MTHAVVHTAQLRELWLHTGTACNLECPFCLEGSKPGDTRLQRMTLAEAQPHLTSAVELGVERFVFTGGEPLIVKDIVKILEFALQLNPCLVLTNGTAPLIKRAHQLQLLKHQPHALAFRVSIDYPDEKLHDAERGWGNFKRAVEGLTILQKAGFEISIARLSKQDEDAIDIAARFRELLAKYGLPSSTRIIPWREFGRPNCEPASAFPTPEEFAQSPHTPMCKYSRMLVKRHDRIRVYACALTDDNPQFELGVSISDTVASSIALIHSRCGQCVRNGVSLGSCGRASACHTLR
jgi:MoaA/NifB/PqqE/SkfB family radical SAM enzyme